MPPPNVPYAKQGGAIEIEIHVGFVVAASFELAHWAQNTKTVIGTGVNNVVSQTFLLKPPVAAYEGHIVAWDIVIGKMMNGDDQYRVTVTIRQDGTTIFTHPWHDKFGSQSKIDIFGGVTLVAA